MTISAGTIIPYGGSSAPSGFLLCDGSAVSRTTYSTLFGVIGTTFGAGDGSTTFNVPDLRGRVVAGKDDMGGSAASRLTSTTMSPDGVTLGATGGEQTHSLVTAELASHSHDVRGSTSGIGNTSVGLKDASAINIQGDDNAGGGSSGFVTNNSASNPYVSSTGSGTAHNNVQPALILNYIIATQDVSGTGTVTSVSMTGDGVIFNSTVSGSPITSSGTLAPSLLTQTANTVLAGPTSGGAATPTFRALVAGDIPALSYASNTLANTHIFVGNGSNVATDVAVSGDATLANTGALTVTKTNGTPFGTMATQNANNVNITGATAITGLPTPTNPSDAVTKSYVDALGAGFSFRNSCRVATTANLTATYSNGSSGVGATLTNSGTQAALSIDGVSLASGDRVLVKDQSTDLQNGIYAVTTVGNGSTNWVLTRATDYDQSSEVYEGTCTVIEEGTANNSTFWVQTQSGTITIGTTSITFSNIRPSSGVTSVGLSLPAEFTVSGSPVTSTGTLSGAWANQTQNKFFASPNGSTGTPGFRAMVGADLPNPSSSTLGGIQSLAAVSHKWINAISTSGVPSATQPDFSDLSGTAGSSQVPTNLRLGSVGTVIDGGGLVLTTGQKGYIYCPYAGTITSATLIADQSGSCVIDVWKAAYPTIPTVANTIVASDAPTLSSAQKSQDTTLTGWTTSVSAGDVFGFNVNSASTITRVMLELGITKS